MLWVPMLMQVLEGAPGLREVQAWRRHQDETMRGERSPFAAERVVALAQGRTTLGSGAEAALRLPGAGLPALAGEVVLGEGGAFLVARDPGPEAPRLLVNGTFMAERALASTDLISFGPYRLQLRRPGGAFALRVANLKAEAMRRYRGLNYFPFDGRFRVAATFTPSPGAREVTVESTQGGPQKLPHAGRLDFKLLGQDCTLDAFLDRDEPDVLFVIFRDGTSGRETYGVGRYVYVARSADGTAVLDFNKAFNPLCAYGPLFFCPIPPKQNHLPLRIPAGEKTYAAH